MTEVAMVSCPLVLGSQAEYSANGVPVMPWLMMQHQFCAAGFAPQPRQAAAHDAAAPGPAGPAGPTSCARDAAQERSGSESTASPRSSAAGDLHVAGQVWSLSRDAQGCRRVQEALEAASTDSERVALAAELRGHVWAAAQCRHANHVLQKCVMTMRAESVQFIIDEITRRGAAATCKAARNQYGCRVLQRLLEHCSAQQVRGLVEDLITDASRLSMHIYGNFVMRHVLEYGPEDQRARFAAHVQERALEMGSDEKGCAVLGKALAHAAKEDRTAIARAVLGQTGLLAAMAGTRHGRVAAEVLVQTAEGPELQSAWWQLTEAAASLGTSRFGRSVLACLPSCTKGTPPSSPAGASQSA